MTTRRSIALAMLAVGFLVSCQVANQPPLDARAGLLDSTQDIQSQAARHASAVLGRLDAAWNAGDGAAFAAEFTENADVINIFGVHFQGRSDISKRMQTIFDGLFRGSVHRARDVEIARHVAPDAILVVSSSVVEVPSGPLSPRTRNRQTFLLVRAEKTWLIRHWHNTTMQDQTN
jgi:uncharacterized protein (TIGR02246 family)